MVQDLKKREERIEGVGFRVEVKGRVKPTVSVWERKIEPSHLFFFGKARCEFGLVFGRARLVAWQPEWFSLCLSLECICADSRVCSVNYVIIALIFPSMKITFCIMVICFSLISHVICTLLV